jgi:hypothetical protein
MIRATSLEITDTHHRWQAEMESRYARRNKIRYIDHLLNELEMLNLGEVASMPMGLRREVKEFLEANAHILGNRSMRGLTIAQSMDALYDIQDSLLLGSEDDEDIA